MSFVGHFVFIGDDCDFPREAWVLRLFGFFGEDKSGRCKGLAKTFPQTCLGPSSKS